jgi:uncharacterized protein (TIGR02301 family)
MSLARRIRLSAAAALAAAALCAPSAPAQDDIVSPIEELERLAQLIGAAHQLRQVCDTSDFTWRQEMLDLIELEARDDNGRQRRMIDAFNSGFRDQERERLSCGADARNAEAELADEGRRLAEGLRDRYLN